MSWLPRVSLLGWTGCENDGEAEGWSLAIAWGRLRIEIAIGLHNGRRAG